MYVELLDKLRCTNEHADVCLVATASRTAHRHLVDATLGCPECGAEYEIRDGELWLAVGLVCGGPNFEELSDEDVMRAAALLNLQERGLYVLQGEWCDYTAALSRVLDADLLQVDPHSTLTRDEGLGTIRFVEDRWPFAPSSLHGIAIGQATPARLRDAVRVLRAGGRLVAPASVELPAGVRELARDDRHCVAEKIGDVISLTRKR